MEKNSQGKVFVFLKREDNFQLIHEYTCTCRYYIYVTETVLL